MVESIAAPVTGAAATRGPGQDDLRGSIDHELVLARTAVRVGASLAALAVAIVLPLRGTAAAVTAVAAVALVSGTFALAGASHAWAARRGPAVLQAVAFGGFLVRLVIYATALVLLRPVDAVDGPVLAITTAIAAIVVLAFEVRSVLAHRELWWVDPTARRAGTTDNADGKARA